MIEARTPGGPAGEDRSPRGRSTTRPRFRILVGALLVFLLFLILLPFGIDYVLNRFIKPRLIESYQQANPGSTLTLGPVQYHLWSNRVSADSIRIESKDSAGTDRVLAVGEASLMRPGIRTLFPGDSDLNRLEGTTVVLSGLDCFFPRTQYRVSCETFTVSFPDSVVEVLGFLVKPDVSDREFFGLDKFRQTRFLVRLPELRVSGFAVLDLLRGDGLAARAVEAPGFLLDAVINKGKPVRNPGEPVELPNVQIATAPFPIRIDNVHLSGDIVYGEEFRGRPGRAILTFSDATIEASDINSEENPDRETKVAASALFVDGAVLRLDLEGPLWSERFQMRAVGSLGPMEISRLNSWTNISDGLKIDLGKTRKADFAINFRGDSATGTVQVIYKDLAVTKIDPQEQSEEGFEQQFATFWLNEVQLRTENIPDDSGNMKIGQVAYRRKPQETFLSYLWLSVRSGLGDTIGF